MRMRAVAVAGVSVALLTACSGTVAGVATASGTPTYPSPVTPSGPDLVGQAADALEQAGAVHMQGSITGDGDPGSLDLHLQGGDLAGTVVREGQTVQLVVTGGAAYVQTTAAWWTAHGAPAAAANGLDGVWVHMPDAFIAQFTEPYSFGALLGYLRDAAHGQFEEPVQADGPDGRPVWELRDVGDAEGFLAIAAEGTPYPVE